MLKRDQILPYLNAYVRSLEPVTNNQARKYVNMSLCHRLVANVLLRGHYRKDEPQCIRRTFEGFPFSPETIRRAVKDGMDIGIIEHVKGGDRRLKLIRASKLLVDCFEETHVESND